MSSPRTESAETAIAGEVMDAARVAYETPVRDDGSSLVSLVNRMVEDDVKKAIALAIMAERERCAKIAETDDRSDIARKYHFVPEWLEHGRNIASAIRLSTPNQEATP